MAIRIRFPYTSGALLGYSIERLVDGAYYDFAASVFRTGMALFNSPIASLPEDGGIFRGRFSANLTPPPGAVFWRGDYLISVHDMNNGLTVVAQLGASVLDGDDATVFPAPTRAIGGGVH